MMHMLSCLVHCVPKIGELLIGTEIVMSFLTELTHTTGLCLGTKTDDVADFEMLDVGTNRNDVPDHFVTGDKRVAGKAPIIVNHVHICCADTRVGNPNIRIEPGQRLRRILVAL